MSSEAVLQKILDLQTKNISIFVPSQNRNMEFKPLNIRQQKDIIKSSLDKNIPGISLNTVLNEIIVENCIEKNINFLVFDRLNIAFNLRKNIFGDKIKLTKINEETGDDEETNIFGSLDKHLSSLNLVINTELVSRTVIADDVLKIEIKTPTLSIDNKANKEAQKNLSHLLEKDNGVKDIISELFVYELTKFVDSISVGEDKLNFRDLSISQQIKTIETLPANVNKEIMDFVEKVRDYEKQYQTFNVDGKDFNVSIDASFFSSE